MNNLFEKFESFKKLNIVDELEFKRLLSDLLDMDVSNEENLIAFLQRRDEVEKHYVTEWCESYFLMTTDVSNEEKKKRYENVSQVLTPIHEEYSPKLNDKFLKSQVSKNLGENFEILRRDLENANSIFHEKNIDLNKEMSKITSEITEIQGKLTARWRGKDVPLEELSPFYRDVNRQTRKEAYEAGLNADESVSDILDEKFSRLLELRQEIAHNAGFDSYTDYRFKEMKRFDWCKEDCFSFHSAVKKHIVPLSIELNKRRKEALKLDTIKPYDTGVDLFGREPLRIHEKGETHKLIEGTGKIIKSIDDELYGFFKKIRDNNLLDLDARENKSPGGYMLMYPVQEMASVFYNGVGMGNDLLVLLHELGHCFHYFLGKDVFPYALQDWTSEVAEAGSMSMEYIGLENMGEYLDPDQCARLKEDKLKQAIGLFKSCSMGDEFQHWIYDNPGHSSQMRREKWNELYEIYYPGIDNSEYRDRTCKTDWQYSHILSMPFYLIDYCISELLALTIWDRYVDNPQDAIQKYKDGCSLAASKPVPEIYKTFGTELSFGEDKIAPLAERLKKELNL